MPADSRPAAEEQVADRLLEEAAALVCCVEWLESLSTQETAVVNLRPEDDYPETDYVAVDQSRVIRVLRRIAQDLEELGRARPVADLSSSGNDADPRMRRRRRMAEPPIELSRRGTNILQGRKAWENYEHQLQKAGLPASPNPYRHLNRSAE
jgi:hypothetical protein